MNKITLIFVLSLLFLFSNKVFAINNVFYDDFNINDLTKWNIVGNTNSWIVVDGKLKGEITKGNTSYIFSKRTGNLKDYELSLDVENLSGIDQHILFRVSEDYTKYYQLELRYGDLYWPQDGNSLRLWRYSNNSYNLVVPDIVHYFEQGVEKHLKVVLVGNQISVFINDVLLMEVEDTDSDAIMDGGVGFHNYAGDYNARPVVNYFDNVKIINNSVDKNKIILIPGMGASWNTKAMVYNQTVGNDQWKMTPFVNNYEGLIDALENNRDKTGTEYYVWNYDWRRPVGEIVSNLNEFINSKVSNGEKVDLVGHSLGGVVARVWAQDHGNDSNSKLGKVISVSSPQHGSIDAYDEWNGAMVNEKNDVSSVALSILVELQKKNKQTKVETLRSYAPILKDLLPVFDFVKINGQVKSSDKLTTKNDYLKTKNEEVSSIFDNYKTISGSGEKTKEWVNLEKINEYDKILGVWPDGKSKCYDFTQQGDGTVLKKSSVFADDGYIEVLSNHGEVVQKGLGNILGELNIENNDLGIIYDDKLMDKLIYFIGSPAGIGVSCDGGQTFYNDDLGFVLIDGKGKQTCSVVITGTENGTYHLVTGKVGYKDSWRYFENETTNGQVDKLIINGVTGEPKTSFNDDYWYQLIKRDILLLQKTDSYKNNKFLIKALSSVNKKNVEELTNLIVEFRHNSKETVITDRIINNLKEILINKYKNVSGNNIKIAWVAMDLEKKIMDNKLSKPTIFKALSRQKINELYTEGKAEIVSKNYPKAWMDLYLMTHLMPSVW